MAEPQELDPFVSTDEVELDPAELAILDALDTDDETQFVSLEDAREHMRQWLLESPLLLASALGPLRKFNQAHP